MRLQLEYDVQWLALAVSAAGGMVLPKPSRAIIGKVSQGLVEQRSLVKKDITSVTSTAPIDAVQALHDVAAAPDVVSHIQGRVRSIDLALSTPRRTLRAEVSPKSTEPRSWSTPSRGPSSPSMRTEALPSHFCLPMASRARRHPILGIMVSDGVSSPSQTLLPSAGTATPPL